MESQPRSLRGLKALVGILGVLVVLGTALVIGVVIQRIYAKPAAPSMSATPAVSAAPMGEHVAGITAAGDYVAVWETGPQGDRILSINLATGAVKPVFSLPP